MNHIRNVPAVFPNESGRKIRKFEDGIDLIFYSVYF